MAVLSSAAPAVLMSQDANELPALVEQYWLRTFHFALQLVGNREDAMDVTQDAFLRLHRTWHRRDTTRPFAPWFYAIVRNLAIDLLRKRTSRREVDYSKAPEMSSGPGPEVLAERTELKTKAWEAISRLPQPQREVLILRDLHGFSYAEIAETIGVPASTVNARLHHARETLRSKLGRYF